jgi:hypothetical protein
VIVNGEAESTRSMIGATRTGNVLADDEIPSHEEGFAMSEYAKPEHRQFIEDMTAAGLQVRHYHGRNFCQGPAVGVDNIHDALSRTTVECRWDHLGLGFIVHPI